MMQAVKPRVFIGDQESNRIPKSSLVKHDANHKAVGQTKGNEDMKDSTSRQSSEKINQKQRLLAKEKDRPEPRRRHSVHNTNVSNNVSSDQSFEPSLEISPFEIHTVFCSNYNEENVSRQSKKSSRSNKNRKPKSKRPQNVQKNQIEFIKGTDTRNSTADTKLPRISESIGEQVRMASALDMINGVFKDDSGGALRSCKSTNTGRRYRKSKSDGLRNHSEKGFEMKKDPGSMHGKVLDPKIRSRNARRSSTGGQFTNRSQSFESTPHQGYNISPLRKQSPTDVIQGLSAIESEFLQQESKEELAAQNTRNICEFADVKLQHFHESSVTASDFDMINGVFKEGSYRNIRSCKSTNTGRRSRKSKRGGSQIPSVTSIHSEKGADSRNEVLLDPKLSGRNASRSSVGGKFAHISQSVESSSRQSDECNHDGWDSTEQSPTDVIKGMSVIDCEILQQESKEQLRNQNAIKSCEFADLKLQYFNENSLNRSDFDVINDVFNDNNGGKARGCRSTNSRRRTRKSSSGGKKNYPEKCADSRNCTDSTRDPCDTMSCRGGSGRPGIGRPFTHDSQSVEFNLPQADKSADAIEQSREKSPTVAVKGMPAFGSESFKLESQSHCASKKSKKSSKIKKRADRNDCHDVHAVSSTTNETKNTCKLPEVVNSAAKSNSSNAPMSRNSFSPYEPRSKANSDSSKCSNSGHAKSRRNSDGSCVSGVFLDTSDQSHSSDVFESESVVSNHSVKAIPDPTNDNSANHQNDVSNGNLVNQDDLNGLDEARTLSPSPAYQKSMLTEDECDGNYLVGGFPKLPFNANGSKAGTKSAEESNVSKGNFKSYAVSAAATLTKSVTKHARTRGSSLIRSIYRRGCKDPNVAKSSGTSVENIETSKNKVGKFYPRRASDGGAVPMVSIFDNVKGEFAKSKNLSSPRLNSMGAVESKDSDIQTSVSFNDSCSFAIFKEESTQVDNVITRHDYFNANTPEGPLNTIGSAIERESIISNDCEAIETPFKTATTTSTATTPFTSTTFASGITDVPSTKKGIKKPGDEYVTQIFDFCWTERGTGIKGLYSGRLNEMLEPHGEGHFVINDEELGVEVPSEAQQKFYGIWENGYLRATLNDGKDALLNRSASKAVIGNVRVASGDPMTGKTNLVLQEATRENVDGVVPTAEEAPSSPSEDAIYSTAAKTIPKHYELGEIARSVDDMVVESNKSDAQKTVSTMQMFDCAFIKRSNGVWSCAILADRGLQPKRKSNELSKESTRWFRPKDLEGFKHDEMEESMLFVINPEGKTKVISKKCWGKFVRRIKE